MTIKNGTASEALSGSRPLAYRVMYLQTKPSEQLKPLIFSEKENEIAFVKIAGTFHIEIDIL